MNSRTASKKEQCTPKPPGSSATGRKVSLPIIDPETGMKRSRAGRWRVYSLAAVHVLMVAHFVQWWFGGNTLTPIEPSESMETIREGAINMGFIFFALAILSTFILGRWVCGWGCHLVAYQDLTLWILKKLHLRPKAFRTRWLFLFTTFVLAAGWMFFLPLGARLYSMYRGEPQPSLEMAIMRTGFWDTFPGPVFAVLTVLIAGMGIIYFLGAKGFCTYACPYGAIFAVADKFSPARIRVTDACTQCGHCTAVCTSNVRVSEEVNLYKMVVDPGCMKCLDCVEVCPNDALYFGMGRPAIGSKASAPRKSVAYDLSFMEEVIATVLFVAVLITVNGLYGEFPFLLSLGIAGIMTYLFMKAGRMLTSSDALMQKVRLKLNGRFQPAGIVFLLVVLVLGVVTAHSAVWRYHDLSASRVSESVRPKFGWQYLPATELANSLTDEERAAAKEQVEHLSACQRIGLFTVSIQRIELAYALMLTGRADEAVAQVDAAVAAHPDRAFFHLWKARIATAVGDPAGARAAYDRAIAIEKVERESLAAKTSAARFSLSSEIWAEYGRFLQSMGDSAGASAALESAVKFDPGFYISRLWLIDSHLASGRMGEARRAAIGAIDHHLESTDITLRLEQVRQNDNDPAGAVSDYKAALERHPGHVVLLNNLAASLAELRRFDEAVAACLEALAVEPDSRGVHATFAGVLMTKGDFPAAIREFETLQRLSREKPDEESRAAGANIDLTLAMLYGQVGRLDDARRILESIRASGSQQERAMAEQMLREIEAASRQVPRP